MASGALAREESRGAHHRSDFPSRDDARWLNKQYSVWGEVIEGMDNVDQIKRGEPVRDPDQITTMRVAADL